MFGPFERLVAGRYLRARKGERFVSIIAIFSLVGIALGVATLIVVSSVMTGFQRELVTRILGVNGHISLDAYAGDKITDYEALTAKIAAATRNSSTSQRFSARDSGLVRRSGMCRPCGVSDRLMPHAPPI